MSASAALKGSQGMQAVIDDNNGIYVTDDSPTAEPRYRARFYFDPNSLPMASGDAHFIFKGFMGTSTEVLRVEFRQSSGAYQLRAALLDDGTAWINTNWLTMSDASHPIELDWQAATGAGANNGNLTLWIDGAQQASLTGVDNDTRRIDRARLGALTGVDTGTRGTYYFDAFESRRNSYIGPLAQAPSFQFASYKFIPLQQSGPYISQPGGTDGVDTYLLNTSPAANNGTAVVMWVGESNNATNKIGRSLIKFDLSSIPANATVSSASLSLWTSDDFSDNDRTIRVYRLKVPFNESQATWNEASAGVSWQSPGASGANDRESVEIGSVQILANEAIGVEKQISLAPAQVQELFSGAVANNGFIIVVDAELNDRFNYKTSDAANGSQRPKLVIQYTVSSSTPTPTVISGPTSTPTWTSTSIATSTSTLAVTNTPTETLTPTASATLSPTGTMTASLTPTSTDTPTPTLTFTPPSTPTALQTPTPIPSGPLTIDYIYDALNRLTSATYNDGRSFDYTYDPAGNVLELEQNLGPGTIITAYTYDEANQLNTAQQGSTTWQYTYDANGSLISDGVKNYTYDSANRLIQVDDQSITTSLSYNGLGQRLSMDAAGVIAHYVIDGDRPLTAESGGNTTFYLYGLGAIGEKTTTWSYSLPDGTNSPRQLSDESGDITLSARYTPWGDTLDTFGTGNFSFGYLGGVLDAATGLLYVGNGHYYDPSTGRFLTREVNPNSPNPYVPWNPIGAIVGPLAVLSMFYSRKKKRSKWDVLIIIALLGISIGIGMAACAPAPTPPPGSNTTAPVIPIQTQTPVPTGPVTIPSDVPTSTPSPVVTLTLPDCPTPTITSILTIEQELRDVYGIILENGNLQWSADQIGITLTAIKDIANRFGSVSTLRLKFNISDSSPIRIIMGTSTSYNPEIINDDCRIIGAGGCTSTNKVINFASLLPNGGNPETRSKTARNNVVHEMGHVFSNEHNNIPETELASHPDEFEERRDEILGNNDFEQWQLNPTRNARETFGDFFVAWTYDHWHLPLTNENGNTRAGTAKAWMDEKMLNW